MKVGIITPTVSKERKPFLDFLKKRIQNQTKLPDVWYLVNYPNTSGKVDITERYIKGLQQAFAEGCDLVLFMEDDDYYPVTYIEQVVNAWIENGKPKLIGIEPTLYYHLGKKALWQSKSIKHASAFCTGVAKGAKIDVCPGNYAFYDLVLWKENESKKLTIIENPPLGIKHGLGKCGGSYHSEKARYDRYDDKEQSILRELVDEEAFNFYKSLNL